MGGASGGTPFKPVADVFRRRGMNIRIFHFDRYHHVVFYLPKIGECWDFSVNRRLPKDEII